MREKERTRREENDEARRSCDTRKQTKRQMDREREVESEETSLKRNSQNRQKER